MEPSFKTLTGDVLVDKNPVQDWIDDKGNTFNAVIFSAPQATFLFTVGIGGPLSFSENETFVTNDTETIFYPPYNEITVQPISGIPTDFSVYKENVSLQYKIAQHDELFVKSLVDFVAYEPSYFVYDDSIYKTLLSYNSPGKSFDDSLLQFSQTFEDPVFVKNVENELCLPIENSKYKEIVENNSNNGALKLSKPASMTNKHKIVHSLSENE